MMDQIEDALKKRKGKQPDGKIADGDEDHAKRPMMLQDFRLRNGPAWARNVNLDKTRQDFYKICVKIDEKAIEYDSKRANLDILLAAARLAEP
ncbi:hypothetical protein AC578_4141 [Pseudocercospora eumusae]|uniref:Uncharacterized protein n=1 Tax=Pseudocercospora eumusae TaxID=321146 RepID=A0A139HF48_9PEZI|nr:hypothetical protein AC578_4141 [Pseudocercospora eumusae]